jgi:hypothetical protein
MNKTLLVALLLAPAVLAGCGLKVDIHNAPEIVGPYLGQEPPGDEAVLFAPGVVSTGMMDRDVSMTPDGKEMYFGRMAGGTSLIYFVRMNGDGSWTDPEVVSFSGRVDAFDFEPHVSPDGNKLFFLSTRPKAGQEPVAGWGNQNIWVSARQEDGSWGEPIDVGLPVNTDDDEFFPTTTKDGTLYFTRMLKADRSAAVYRSRLVDGRYSEPEKLPDHVNSVKTLYNAFMSPDERYLIACVPGKEGNIGAVDYHIAFRNEQDRWTELINLGDAVNAKGDQASSPYVSPDGKVFFFGSSRKVAAAETDRFTLEYLAKASERPGYGSTDTWWIDAGFIRELRAGLKEEDYR